jgi:hypothetical protein
MELTDWIVMLAIALMAVAFLCARSGRRATFAERSRRRLGTRLVAQGTLALWAALLMLERCMASPGTALFGRNLDTHVGLALALTLIAAGSIWAIRGRRLLRTRRIFSAC